MKKSSKTVVPAESPRQPVHTVYGGAHLLKADSTPKLGALALRALEEYAPTPRDLAEAIGLERPGGRWRRRPTRRRSTRASPPS